MGEKRTDFRTFARAVIAQQRKNAAVALARIMGEAQRSAAESQAKKPEDGSARVR